jgi:hypothetical protein
MLAKNVGTTDRIIRIVIGLALIVAYVLNPAGSYSWLYLVGAAAAILTGLLSFCGLYTLLGIKTCKR